MYATTLDHYIDGTWVQPTSGKSQDVMNPAKNTVLDEWCAKLERDPGEIERTVLIMEAAALVRWQDYVTAGARHLIVGLGTPFDLTPVARLLTQARGGG